MAKERVQAEGSIYCLKDGLWVTQFTILGKYLSKSFKLQSDTREGLQAAKAQIRRGLICNTIYSSISYTNKYRKENDYE